MGLYFERGNHLQAPTDVKLRLEVENEDRSV